MTCFLKNHPLFIIFQDFERTISFTEPASQIFGMIHSLWYQYFSYSLCSWFKGYEGKKARTYFRTNLVLLIASATSISSTLATSSSRYAYNPSTRISRVKRISSKSWDYKEKFLHSSCKSSLDENRTLSIKHKFKL